MTNKTEVLRNSYIKLCSIYCKDPILIEAFWNEIYWHYCESHRAYHNLDHIYYLLTTADLIRPKIDDFESIMFSIFYHDIVYDLKSKDNEAQSALRAAKRLSQLDLPTSQVAKIALQIEATKEHNLSEDPDTNYLLDLDLAILGESKNIYKEYSKSIRSEYSIYPDILYKSGRKKVLTQLLKKDIFKTPEFIHKNKLAQKNLSYELKNL